jgi:arylsulfatase
MLAMTLIFASFFIMAGCEGEESSEVDKGLYEASRRIIERSGKLRDRAASFDQYKALRSIGKNPYTGFVFRFDDNLVSGEIELPERASSIEGGLFAHDFSEGDGPFYVSGGKHVSHGDALKVRSAAGRYMFTDMQESPLRMRRDDIDKVIITARHERGTRMEFLINKDMPGGYPENNIWLTVIDVIPDGDYHDYIIEADRAFNPQTTYIDGIAVGLSDASGDTVDIKKVEFISQRYEYNRIGAGVSSANRGRVLSPVLFMVNGSSVSYKITMPEAMTRFFAGLSIADAREPVTFSLSVDGDTVFEKTVSDVSRWHETELPIIGREGEDVTVTLSCEGAEGGVGLWSYPALRSEPDKRFNVIVLLQDALRADHLSCYGYGRDTSPVADGLAAHGALFRNCFSQAAKTIVSVPSIMTGLYPTATGVWDYPQSLDEGYVTIAEAMRSQGYATGSFLQNGHAGPEYGMEQGFDYLTFVGNRPEQAFGPRLFAWMERNRDTNFFAYVHIIDPHGVYDPGGPYDEWYRAAGRGAPVEPDTRLLDPDWVESPTGEGRAALYDGEIRRNDEALKGLLMKLDELGIYEDTMIVMVSDHGEYLGEHGLWEHKDPTYRPVVTVPMIFHYPAGVRGPLIIDENVQMIDLFPTILDYAGIDAKTMLFHGDSLRCLMENSGEISTGERICISDEILYRSPGDGLGPTGSIFFGDMHFMYSGSHNLDSHKHWHAMLFDTALDTDESEDLLDGGASEEFFMDTLRQVQSANIDINHKVAGGRSATVNVDPVVREQLKALGYVQ